MITPFSALRLTSRAVEGRHVKAQSEEDIPCDDLLQCWCC